MLGLMLGLGALLALSGAQASGQAYTSIVVFGDSLSDTGNVAHVIQAGYQIRYPGASFNYADGRLTDSAATTPAARLYTGLWIEQLSARLPATPPIVDSLDGGTNYAFAAATTADGTTSISLAGSATVAVENMGQQVTDYLTSRPTIPAATAGTTLYVLWGGSNDLFADQSSVGAQAAAARELALLERLRAAGATHFLVPNVPPLGATPQVVGTSNAASYTAAAGIFNQTLAAGLTAQASAHMALTIASLDVFSLFTAEVGPPLGSGVVNATASAQGLSGINPDQYLFWDNVHPTTFGHSLIATAGLAAISPAPPTSPSLAASLSPASLTVAHGSSGSSTLTLTPAGGFSGTATLACGTLPAHLSCAFSNSSLTFTASSSGAQTSTLTIGTTATASLGRGPFALGELGVLCLLLPLLLRTRRGRRVPTLLVLLVSFASLAALGAVTGCGGTASSPPASSDTAPGTYTIPVTVTVAGAATPVTLTVVVQ